VFAADGRSTLLDEHDLEFTVHRADHTVNLIKLPDQHFFHTLRSKLMWGLRHSNASNSDSEASEPGRPNASLGKTVDGSTDVRS
jgi:NAD+ kinase